jgi:hypothetical protein
MFNVGNLSRKSHYPVIGEIMDLNDLLSFCRSMTTTELFLCAILILLLARSISGFLVAALIIYLIVKMIWWMAIGGLILVACLYIKDRWF